ncbi:hypothetical protein CVT24_012274 [Panaeolus cyanescens]|uniref:Uncharacterized protein n=1 Tax=Panaeolus cyanescens TaxID=181874 RepID=A0A409WK61_9AGAR|nr:hypothetical protein CVT24_012274 [Panaeolus cyanescens]
MSQPTPFSFGVRLGIYFTIQSACLSAASVLFILGFTAYKRARLSLRTWRKGTRLTYTDASDSGLFLNLMIADLVQAIGTLPNAVWMRKGMVSPGSLCTAQAAIKQIGIVGVALMSLAIAIHTFLVLVLRCQVPRRMSRYAIGITWLFTVIILVIPNRVHRSDDYYGPTGFWCWITSKYSTERIVTEYLWVWLSAFVMVVLYGAMFLVMRGWVIIDEGVHWYKNYQESSDNSYEHVESEETRRTKAIANSMLYYPLVYIVCVFPNTISRWLSFEGYRVPYQFVLFANSIFALSGLFNLVLFFLTRPKLVIGQPLDGDDQPSHLQINLPERPSAAMLSPKRSCKFGYLADLRTPSPSFPLEHSNDDGDTSKQSARGTLTLVESPTSPLPGDSASTLNSKSDSKAPMISKDATHQEPQGASRKEDEDYGYLP